MPTAFRHAVPQPQLQVKLLIDYLLLPLFRLDSKSANPTDFSIDDFSGGGGVASARGGGLLRL